MTRYRPILRLVRRAARSLLLVAAACLVNSTPAAGRAPGPAEVRSQPAGESDLRALEAANGLLRRGLFDLAEPEFRTLRDATTDEAVMRLAHYGLAVCLVELKRPAEAVVELESVATAKEFEYAVETCTLLGRCLLMLAKPADAAVAFDRVVREYPDHELAPAAAAGAIEAHYRAGAYAVAIERSANLSTLVANPALHARTLYIRALAQVSLAQYPAAIESLQTLLAGPAAAEFAADVRRLLGECQARTGNCAAALATLQYDATDTAANGDSGYWVGNCQLRLENFSAAAEALHDYLDAHPDGSVAAEARYDLAVALVRLNRYTEAETALADFPKRFPISALVPAALHLSAIAAFERGDDAECAARCAAFLDSNSSHALAVDVLHLAAVSAARAQRWPDALQLSEAFVQEFPDDERSADASYRAGFAAYRLEKIDVAERWLLSVTGDGALPERFQPAALILGDIAFQRDSWAGADRWLSMYLAADADADAASADEALLKRGMARAHLGQPREAVVDFSALLARSPQSPHAARANYERGQALVQLGERDAADQAFASAVLADANSSLALSAAYQQAVLAMQAGDFANAVARFSKVIDARESDSLRGESLFQRGQCHLAMNDLAASLADMTAVIADYPDHPRAHAASAWSVVARARRGDAQEALDACERLSAETIAGLDFATRNTLLAERAHALRTVGRTEEASAAYADLVAASDLDDQGRAHAELALAELKLNKEGCPQVLERLQRMANVPADAIPPAVRERVLYRLGACSHEAAAWDEAALVLDALIDEFPESRLHAAALLYAGEAHMHADRNEIARAHFTRLMEEYPDHDAFAPACLRLGECLAKLQHWPRSERVLADFLQRFPDHPQWFAAQFGVGWACENQQHYANAIAAYRKLTARHAGSTAARAQFQIGECLFAQGDHAAAAGEFLKVDILYAYPEWSAAALYEAGRCFELLNRRAEARTQFTAVVERFRDSQWAQAAADRLPKLAEAGPPGH